ncbi:MAG: Dolichyl-phosphate-mannose-protein mannosyltransferase family protein [Candidatus Amesbacteria bacterium GW2011_GWA2_47_11b]|uniref:Polyprenol-phosphate-mannose--protein mannosyltransferase n=3 Tax=Candidatus Amesiibacteriota TaxID=1752730 RepID=A0A0G1SKH5_9BACT|nr:MAG: Dolichyl-phosphate-mannose-protein mannosyltransferase family protein [Microgenomates group bacterium GW2011_GWC1_46_20]KKU57979.1 MAG: Dolichyl-phosphate-mannose-protein mannosyltransferase family protein [Candidatus Amesbacteria bacterium GW2011_GWA2_47_11b]KKU69994.1 MAG: Dolichyl-phosphate-mannose-protein mannosyltransferase family protein [Candidatus Amesbacteria bacterium GW2011_GWA1_47_20]KKU84869.1 MAG: Dolichyl-phosphate-mannose-protein mannosyltransferase family protein [Candid
MQKEWFYFFLVILTIFLSVTRIIGLSSPSKHYFDEVYHAFTAQEMFKGNQASWEWWNTPPSGFAYEWTHPPLAKLGMVLGLKLAGNSPLGWRLPGAILGILSGFLVYLITQRLTSNHTTSLLALFLYTFDGLPLVMSRIGMNDIYLVFFILSTFYFLLSKRQFLASVAFGLALASKWSAIYFLPMFIYYVWRTPYYLLIPPIIYLIAYLPFLLTHPLTQFIELQKQMWWYHTGLKATHSYSSPAITWPIMFRPVWAFVEYLKSSIANIYIQGNPVIWWAGLLAVGYQTLRRRITLPLILYWLFLIPWIVSPRIMFLYHYFPSLVFMYIILAQTFRPRPWFILLVIVGFLFFSPRYFGFPIPNQFLNYLVWLPSWR